MGKVFSRGRRAKQWRSSLARETMKRSLSAPMNLRALICIALFGVAVMVTALAAAQASAQHPNVVFILVDDMGQADLGG